MLQYSLFLSNRFGFCPWSSREMRLLICVHEEKCFLLFVCLYAQKHLPHSLRGVYEVHEHKL